MKNYAKDFGPFDGKIWFNCASEGALPNVSIEALHEAGEWKRRPYELTLKRFGETPRLLKRALGALMNVVPTDVILGNSATYGIHLLANGIPLAAGDEVLLMQNDFPTDILPWLGLEQKGVAIQQIKPAGHVITPEELESHITSATKVVCLSHVHTFTGHMIDIQSIGNMCRKKGIIFILNLSQTLGNQPVDVSSLPVDAITCAAFKWLLGPYGTGFCWIRPELRDSLEYYQAYWGNVMTEEQLASEDVLTMPKQTGAKRYDMFGTANFFNFKPLTVSIEYLLSIGLDNVKHHNDGLGEQFISNFDKNKYDLISPEGQSERSALIVFSHIDPNRNSEIFQTLLKEGIYPALWKNRIRISPHIFNTQDDVNRLLDVLLHI